MKKKVALVTVRNEMKNMYYEELNSVFSDYLDIIPYSLEIDHVYHTSEDMLRLADVVLLTNPDNFTIIKHIVHENCKILYLDCAFLKNKVESLRSFPPNTNALICFNYFDISNQAATTIYEMGITNLNLSVYDPSEETSDKDYDIAIVGENSAIVPEKINTIVSLGKRKISPSTLLDLAVTTGVMNDKLENRIFEYSKELAIPSVFINDIYTSSSNAKTQLQTIMDSIDYSIIILNKDLEIMNYNENLLDMFHINKSILNMKITEIPEFHPISEHILEDKQVKDLLIQINKNKNVVLNIQRVNKKIDTANSYIILMKDVTDILKLENTLKKQLDKKGHLAKYNFSDIFGNSKEIKDCIHKAKIISKLDKAVLIIGESGTGKELFSQSIHNASPRKNFPFLGINCAALPSNLLESELFGYEEGTFTGGLKGGKAGLFEIANNGTLFLDEIGDMSLVTQAKVLRVLEEKEFMRLGGSEIISVNVRIIAATNRDLRALIKENKFRLDLYYRLNTLMFKIPPLRKRKEDIMGLTKLFMKNMDSPPITISHEVKDFLVNHSWEGNIRELKNCIEYMVSISGGNIDMSHLPDYISEELEDMDNSQPLIKDNILNSLNDYERELVLSLMEIVSTSGGGRRSIYQELKKDFDNLSEYKLRSFINLLVENNMIQLGTGRRGMNLTEEGRNLLQFTAR